MIAPVITITPFIGHFKFFENSQHYLVHRKYHNTLDEVSQPLHKLSEENLEEKHHKVF